MKRPSSSRQPSSQLSTSVGIPFPSRSVGSEMFFSKLGKKCNRKLFTTARRPPSPPRGRRIEDAGAAKTPQENPASLPELSITPRAGRNFLRGGENSPRGGHMPPWGGRISPWRNATPPRGDGNFPRGIWISPRGDGNFPWGIWIPLRGGAIPPRQNSSKPAENEPIG